MKFGMNLLLWSDDIHDGMMPVLEKIKRIGFDGVEVPLFDINIDKWQSWAKRLDDLGLERTATTVCNEEANPISQNPTVRSQSVDMLKQTLDCCQALGAYSLNGPLHSGLGIFSGTAPSEQEWEWGVENLKRVSEHAAVCDVLLGIEFLNRFETYFLTCTADAVKFVREIDHPNCRMMYDTFHAHIEEKNVAESIRSCAEYLIQFHTSENDRSTPGSGGVDWNTTFDTLKEINYDGWLTIEAFGQSLEDLMAATKIWRRMYGSEEQLASDGLKFLKQEVAKRW
jgi:D-psicose/D-tagatose/L-ribulose 3-epimerase